MNAREVTVRLTLLPVLGALTAGPALAAPAGWVCHWNVQPNEFLKSIGLESTGVMEKFELRPGELVVLPTGLPAADVPEFTSHYHIVEANDVGIVATMGGAEKGDVYAETVSILRGDEPSAVKMVSSVKDPKANEVMTGNCIPY